MQEISKMFIGNLSVGYRHPTYFLHERKLIIAL